MPGVALKKAGIGFPLMGQTEGSFWMLPGKERMVLLLSAVLALPLCVTCSASSLDRLTLSSHVERVIGIESVPINAMSLPGAHGCCAVASHVVNPRWYGLQVKRIHTPKVAVVADVINFESVGDWPVELNVNGTRGHGHAPFKVGLSVAVRHPMTLPNPTFISISNRGSQVSIKGFSPDCGHTPILPSISSRSTP